VRYGLRPIVEKSMKALKYYVTPRARNRKEEWNTRREAETGFAMTVPGDDVRVRFPTFRIRFGTTIPPTIVCLNVTMTRYKATQLVATECWWML
jgi:hypothetical protein